MEVGSSQTERWKVESTFPPLSGFRRLLAVTSTTSGRSRLPPDHVCTVYTHVARDF
jgi:hypothetical protein